MSTKDRGRPSKRRATELGDEILAMALTFFRTQGYEATTIEGLAKALGCSKHTIYRRFADKEALFVAAVEHDRQAINASISAIDISETNTLKALQHTCRALFDLTMKTDTIDLYRACIGAVSRFPTIGSQFIETERGLQDIIEAALRAAQGDGHVVDGPSRILATQLYYATISEAWGHALLGLEHLGTPDDQAELFARNWSMFMSAYGQTPSQSGIAE